MRTQSQAPAGALDLWGKLANWLALAALLALGVVWPPADAGAAGAERAGSLWLKSAADATLATCDPFASLENGGPLRRVVTADLLDAPPPATRMR